MGGMRGGLGAESQSGEVTRVVTNGVRRGGRDCKERGAGGVGNGVGGK